MEATGAVIVLIFLATIFSSVGEYKKASPLQTVIAISQAELTTVMTPFFVPDIDGRIALSVTTYVNSRAKKLAAQDSDLIIQSILKHSENYNVNQKLITALIDRESGFDPKALSPSNAQGLAQLLPSTALHIGIMDPFDIDQGAKGCALYTRMMLDTWTGYPDQIILALASYAEGPNAVKRNGGKFANKTAKYIQDILDKADHMN